LVRRARTSAAVEASRGRLANLNSPQARIGLRLRR
jgi:hypothetical protein